MQTVQIDGVTFKHGLSGPDLKHARKRIEHSRIVAKQLSNELREVIKLGETADVEQAVSSLISSPDAILSAAITANKKLKPQRRQSLERCLNLPDKLTFDKKLLEDVPVRPKAKKSGGVRVLHDHGLVHRTGQHVVLPVMGELFTPRSFQYTMAGVQAAIAKIKKLLKVGYVHAARLDIKEFYASFDPDKLVHELPLPKGAVEYVVTGRHMKVTLDQVAGQFPLPPHEHLLNLARLGIPLGSACSPIIGAYCLSRLVWTEIEGVVVINYADDFLLLALTEQRLKEAIEKLIGAVAILPGGHFELRLKTVAKVTTGIDFLGHNLCRDKGHVRILPTFGNCNHTLGLMEKVEGRLTKAVMSPGTTKLGKDKAQVALAILAEMHGILDGWLAAFSECDDLSFVEDIASDVLWKWAACFGFTMEQVAEAVDPSMLYQPTDYALGH